MRQDAVPIDRAYVVRQTSDRNRQMKDFLKRAEALGSDSRAGERAEEGLCRVCFYLSARLGGAAMTTRACGMCGTDSVFGSTYTDALCRDCAELHKLCRHCGADLELDQGREEFAFPKAPEPECA